LCIAIGVGIAIALAIAGGLTAYFVCKKQREKMRVEHRRSTINKKTGEIHEGVEMTNLHATEDLEHLEVAGHDVFDANGNEVVFDDFDGIVPEKSNSVKEPKNITNTKKAWEEKRRQTEKK
jgi:hypothetical protein